MNKSPAGAFYRHLLRDAWRIALSHKKLWIFGFFVSFLGVGGVYELLVQGTGKLGLSRDFGGLVTLASLFPTGPEMVAAFRSLETTDAFALAAFTVAGLSVAVLALWVVVSSLGGLISAIREADRGKKTRFAEAFAQGGETFWPLLWLNLLARFAITASFYLLLALMVWLLSEATLLSSLLYLAAFLVAMPFTLIVGFVTIYADAYIVLHRKPLIEGIETAAALFKKYWLISLETALLLFLVNVAVSLAIGVGFGFLALMFFPLAIGASAVGFQSGIAVAAGIGAVVIVGLIVVIGAWLTTFQYSAWTLLFLKLTRRDRDAVSKVERVFNRLLGR